VSSSNHPLYRALWGWLGAPEVGLLKLFQGPVIRQAAAHAHVVQVLSLLALLVQKHKSTDT
jgi:hypothetical protein